MAKVFFGKIFGSKLVLWRTFPQKIDVKGGSQGLCLLQHLGGRRLLKTEQHDGPLDFAALARRRLDLQGGVALREYFFSLEVTAVFVENVHNDP